jgi:hypothetical protein
MDVQAYALAWLRKVGQALATGRRVIDGDRFQLVLKYPSLEDLLTVAQQLDALEAMAGEDALAREE